MNTGNQASLNLVVMRRCPSSQVSLPYRSDVSYRVESIWYLPILQIQDSLIFIFQNERSNMNIDVVKLRNKLSCLDERGRIVIDDSGSAGEYDTAQNHRSKDRDLEGRYRTEESHYLYVYVT